MTLLNFRVLFHTTALLLSSAAGGWAGNVLLNGGVDTVGPNGSPFTGSGPSAALAWTQFTVVPNSTITSDLETSTDPLGGGEMVHIITDNGYYAPAAQGNAFYQSFSTLPSATASFDIEVISGKVTGGLGLASGPFAQFNVYQNTGGWQHVVETINAPVTDLAFEVLTTGAGAEYYLDNLQVTQIPEPRFMLIPAAALTLYLIRKRRLNSD